MVIRALNRLNKLWETWDIRAFIVSSLLIQSFLTVLAPRRKSSTSSLLKFSMWVLYLSADVVAIFTIGLISSSQGGGDPAQSADLQAFWAPFLLIHLGGPDTITALALEDNELWHRHVLQLVTHLAMTIYVFVRAVVLGGKNDLWVPTVLIFVDGFIKYFERTRTLYFANINNFRDSLQNEKLSSTKGYADDDLMLDVDGVEENDENAVVAAQGWYQVKETDEMVEDAYRFYEKFRHLIPGAILPSRCRDESMSFFLQQSPSKAFKIVEIELNIMYDVFYTKVYLLHKKLGYARVFCFLSVVASLVLFSFKDKSKYNKVDVGITFALLGGATTLDAIATVMFVFSDWCIIITSWNHQGGACSKKLLKSPLVISLLKWFRSLRNPYGRPRWSHSISQYSVLTRCFKNNPPWYMKYVSISRLKEMLIGWLYVKQWPIDEGLKDLIIKEIREKARDKGES